MSERGERFLHNSEPERRWRRDVIGASVFQTPGSIQSELAKVDGEIMAFDAELEGLARQHGVQIAGDWMHGTTESYTGTDPIARFYIDAWVPFRKSWHSWKSGNDSWWHNFWTNEAPTAEAFQRKLAGYQEAARQLNAKIYAPPPDVEGMSVADPRRRGPADYAGDAIDATAKVVKVAAYAAIGLGGAFALVEIVKAARTR